MSSDSYITQYKDLIKIKVQDNNEPLVEITVPSVVCCYEKEDMLPILGNKFLVRSTVLEKIKQAAQSLKEKTSNKVRMRIVYAYRHPDIQKSYFEKQKEQIRKKFPNLSEEELVSKTHLFVASPDMAGHPTGGAIDVTLENSERPLDMGSKIADFSDPKIKTFAENLTNKQKENRMLLRTVFLEVGFAPFNGEWWHFSYGDKEWAFYYKKPYALYDTVYKEKAP